MNMILEQSQRSITSCLLDNPVPCTGLAGEPPTTSGTNPQTPHKTPLLLSCPLTLALFQIPLTGNKNSQQNMSIPGKDLLLCWRARLTKTNIKKIKRRKTRDQRKSSSKIRLQKKRRSGPSDANVTVIRGEHEVKRKNTSESSSSDPEDFEEPSLVETEDENSDIDAECLYCSGPYTRDRRGEKWIKCTKCYKWCHEECSGTDDWKTFLCFSATLNKCSARLP
jgi:hypothetical protein